MSKHFTYIFPKLNSRDKLELIKTSKVVKGVFDAHYKPGGIHFAIAVYDGKYDTAASILRKVSSNDLFMNDSIMEILQQVRRADIILMYQNKVGIRKPINCILMSPSKYILHLIKCNQYERASDLIPLVEIGSAGLGTIVAKLKDEDLVFRIAYRRLHFNVDAFPMCVAFSVACDRGMKRNIEEFSRHIHGNEVSTWIKKIINNRTNDFPPITDPAVISIFIVLIGKFKSFNYFKRYIKRVEEFIPHTSVTSIVLSNLPADRLRLFLTNQHVIPAVNEIMSYLIRLSLITDSKRFISVICELSEHYPDYSEHCKKLMEFVSVDEPLHHILADLLNLHGVVDSVFFELVIEYVSDVFGHDMLVKMIKSSLNDVAIEYIDNNLRSMLKCCIIKLLDTGAINRYPDIARLIGKYDMISYTQLNFYLHLNKIRKDIFKLLIPRRTGTSRGQTYQYLIANMIS
jgi:hypothetical protein